MSDELKITSVKTAKKAGAAIKKDIDDFIKTNSRLIANKPNIKDKNKIGNWMIDTMKKGGVYFAKSNEIAEKWLGQLQMINAKNKNVIDKLDTLDDEEKQMILDYIINNKEELNNKWNEFVTNKVIDIKPSDKKMLSLYKKLFRVVDYTSSNKIGKGEVLISVLFGGQLVSDKRGDVKINDKTYEVKTQGGAIMDGNLDISDIDMFLRQGIIYINNHFQMFYITSKNDCDKFGIQIMPPDMNRTFHQAKYWSLK